MNSECNFLLKIFFLRKEKAPINLYSSQLNIFLRGQIINILSIYAPQKQLFSKVQQESMVFILHVKLIHFLAVEIYFWQHQITPLILLQSLSFTHVLSLRTEWKREARDSFTANALQAIMFQCAYWFRVFETHMILIDTE